jgi:putative toxin-antitoxin system antitoxin component (TIGR02293 family)
MAAGHICAYASTLHMLGARLPRGQRGELVRIDPRALPVSSLERLSRKLGIDQRELLQIVGIPERTAARRTREGYLKPDEADRLLRVARVAEEAERVFGSAAKAQHWLKASHPILDEAPPLELLGSDAGAQAVADELVRIDYGDFA